MSSQIVQIPVRMGSNKMVIRLSQSDPITCRRFVELVLARCHMDARPLAHTYALFESLNGVESRLRSKRALLQAHTPTAQLIVRKYASGSERHLATTIGNEQHQRLVKKCYKKLNQASLVELPASNKVHLTSLEHEYLSQKPSCAAEKLPAEIGDSKEDRHGVKMARNVSILQSLYSKLRKSNSVGQRHFGAAYERLVEADSCGNSSDEEVSSNGSRISTASLQKFESLV